ncbi:hypothetical protein Fcan01_24339 [Folsomia candida]|uniref:Uncharacterized protein n=1 Tax=Folsomia candida TaxID=158441 RepID=A0A226D9N7_FOLCA|nr:hypothetical protein Fcan01_24339 [Folsomia candida]
MSVGNGSESKCSATEVKAEKVKFRMAQKFKIVVLIWEWLSDGGYLEVVIWEWLSDAFFTGKLNMISRTRILVAFLLALLIFQCAIGMSESATWWEATKEVCAYVGPKLVFVGTIMGLVAA